MHDRHVHPKHSEVPFSNEAVALAVFRFRCMVSQHAFNGANVSKCDEADVQLSRFGPTQCETFETSGLVSQTNSCPI